MRPPFCGIQAVALAVCLVATPVYAEPASDPSREHAQALFDEGELKYSTSDYAAAIEAFTDAYEAARRIDDPTLRNNAVKSMLFNLARAHTKAYGVDQDERHLRTANDLFEKYLRMEGELADELEAEGYVRQIREQLAEAGETRPPAPATGGGEPPPGEHGPGANPVMKPDARPQRTPVNGLLIAGIGVTALSAAGIGLVIAGSVGGRRSVEDYKNATTDDERSEADARGRRMNALAITGGVVSAALIGTGIALIVLAKKRDKRRITLVPAGMGFAVVGRF